MDRDTTKHVFGVSDKATQTSLFSVRDYLENLNFASSMILSNKGITTAQISLRGWVGWSEPLLFPNPDDRFSRVEANMSR